MDKAMKELREGQEATVNLLELVQRGNWPDENSKPLANFICRDLAQIFEQGISGPAARSCWQSMSAIRSNEEMGMPKLESLVEKGNWPGKDSQPYARLLCANINRTLDLLGTDHASSEGVTRENQQLVAERDASSSDPAKSKKAARKKAEEINWTFVENGTGHAGYIWKKYGRKKIKGEKYERSSIMASSSSSQQGSQSKRKNRPVGPIQIDGDGCPFGIHYAALSERISRHVCHCDEFSPALTWPDHKNSGRVEALYHELTGDFGLPAWNENGDIAKKFRKWFNDNARKKWNDNKNRSLRRTFDRCQGSISEASTLQPDRVDNETWLNLLSTYEKNSQDDGSGSSKREKCKASRVANDLPHRMGRDSLSVWKIKFRDARGREPNAKEIYNKEFLKIDALDAPEGELPMPRTRGKPVNDEVISIGLQLERNYDAAIADGSDESTASTRATLETFGRVTRLGLHVNVPRDTRPIRRDAYTAQLEQQLQAMKEQSEADRQRIASLEATQREMVEFMARFTASQQSAGQPSGEGDDGAGGGDDGA